MDDVSQLSAFRYGVRLGTLEERERIVALIEEVWKNRCAPVLEPNECSICWLTSSIIDAIKGKP